MVFIGQLLSNLTTLVLFAAALFVVGRHIVHSVQAIGQVLTLGAWGTTAPAWLVQRGAASLGVLLAMTSGFGLEWWSVEGAAIALPPRVPHLAEFLGPFMIGFCGSLFGAWPWEWYLGTLGTPVWGLRIVLLAGSTIFILLLLRAVLARQIWVRDAWGAVVAVLKNFFGGFLGMAMVTYWWPAGMEDRPFFTIVMIVLCFMALGAVGGSMQGGTSSSSSSSYSGGSPVGGDRASKPEGDDFWEGTRKRSEAEAKAYDKMREDERKAWEKRDKDTRQRREDEEAQRKKDKAREEAENRRREDRAAEELKWQAREAASKAEHERKEARKKAEFEAEQRRKDEEKRRNNGGW